MAQNIIVPFLCLIILSIFVGTVNDLAIRVDVIFSVNRETIKNKVSHFVGNLFHFVKEESGRFHFFCMFNKQKMNIVHIRLSHIDIDELLLPNVCRNFLCFLNNTSTGLVNLENVTKVLERCEFHNCGDLINFHLDLLFSCLHSKYR